MKKTLDEWRRENPALTYGQLYEMIMEEIRAGRAAPVKASGTNGQHPALYRTYRISEEKKVDSRLLEELDYQLSPWIQIDYYRKHLEEYQKDREYIGRLSFYLDHEKESLTEPASVNERSFEIFGREKFLQKEGGKKLLSRAGIAMEELHCYETTEPISYYSNHKRAPQNLLILENKDTFFSMRRHLLRGSEKILGEEFGTLIYGGGKRVLSAAKDFSISMEPYILNSSNRIYYFGDLDYEGILIFESLHRLWEGERRVEPMKEAYLRMVKKAEARYGGWEALPDTKPGQNKGAGDLFFSYFQDEAPWAGKMRTLLEAGKYIPQECLTERDF